MSETKYYAHTAKDAGGKPLPESSGKWQPLKDHLQNVAALARRFAEAARPALLASRRMSSVEPESD